MAGDKYTIACKKGETSSKFHQIGQIHYRTLAVICKSDAYYYNEWYKSIKIANLILILGIYIYHLKYNILLI